MNYYMVNGEVEIEAYDLGHAYEIANELDIVIDYIEQIG